MSQTVKQRSASVDETETTLKETVEALEDLSASDVQKLNDAELASLRTTLKTLEDASEEARKNVADEEVAERIEPGESLQGLNHIQSHSKYVKDSVSEVVMRAVGQGVDYTKFVSLDATTLASDFPELADVGKSEYTYIR